MKGSTAPAPPRRDLLWRLQLAVLVVISLSGAIIGFRAFQDFVMEDSYITLRYARNLAEGNGFVFTPGERVLGTTTPLYTMILAITGLLGADIAVASDVLFALCIGALALVGGLLLRRLGTGSGAILFAVFAVYGIDRLYFLWGMETALAMVLVLGSTLLAIDRRYIAASILAALAFLTRYDAALFAISLYAVIFLRERKIPWKPGFVALAIVAPWLLFSQFYFGSVMPNTLGAKTGEISFSEYFFGAIDWKVKNVWHPLRYLHLQAPERYKIGLALNSILGLGFLVALYRMARREHMLSVLLLFSVGLLLGYSVIGPPLAFFWYLMPAVFFTILLSLFGWGALLERFKFRRHAAWAFFIPIAACMYFLPQSKASEASSYMSSSQYRARVTAYDHLADWIIENDLTEEKLLTLEPGYITYRTENPAIDAAGLVTKGVYFHGDRSKRTSFGSLIQDSEPGLAVAGIPYRPPGYLLAYSALPRIRLLLRQDIFMVRFKELAERYQALPTAAELEGVKNHPFYLDVQRGSVGRWARAGGTLLSVGRGLPLTIQGRPVSEAHLVLKQRNPGTVSGSETAPFLIDFERLSFRFAATHPHTTVAQLVVKGQVVLTLGGNSKKQGSEFPYVSFPTAPWKGQIGRLRFLISSLEKNEWLAADHIRSIVDKRSEVFDDFEPRGTNGSDAGYGPRWQQSFQGTPQRIRPTARSFGLEFLTSKNFASSQTLQGVQEMVSHPFVVDYDRMEMLMFDFGGSPTMVELVVEGEVVAAQHGRNQRRIRPLLFNLAPHRGKEAVLRIRDTNPEPGVWIGVDEIRMWDLQPVETGAK